MVRRRRSYGKDEELLEVLLKRLKIADCEVVYEERFDAGARGTCSQLFPSGGLKDSAHPTRVPCS